MNIISEPQHTPTLIHVPKNAGSFIKSTFIVMNRLYRQTLIKENIQGWRFRTQKVQLESGRQLSCVIYVAEDSYLKNKNVKPDQQCTHTDHTDLQTIIKALDGKLIKVFFICADPVKIGMGESWGAIDLICQTQGTSPCYFVCLREPFSRAKSLFEYSQHSSSSHEPSHLMYGYENFHNFACSYDLEDSWVIRHILNLSQNHILHKSHFEHCCQILDGIRVFDYLDASKSIDEIFKTCYGVSISMITSQKDLAFTAGRNKTIYKHNYQFSNLSTKEQEIFKARTHWDLKLFERYVVSKKYPLCNIN
jgi:hypothetical protein